MNSPPSTCTHKHMYPPSLPFSSLTFIPPSPSPSPSPLGVCAFLSRSAASCCAYTCILLNVSGCREEVGGREGNRKEVAWEKRRWGGHRLWRGRVCVYERERLRMGGSITHPDWEEGRTDSVLVPLTDRQRWKESGDERQT